MLRNVDGQRVYFRARKPNPLFEKWLEHWLSEAQRKESPKRFALAKALESLRKYPLVLCSGRDCSILEGFGSAMCRMLDKQLEMHRANNPGDLLAESEIEAHERTVLDQVKGRLHQTDVELTEEERKRREIEALYRKYDIIDSKATHLGKRNALKSSEILCDFLPPKVVLGKGTFRIILLVDTQETAGKSKRSLDATIQSLVQHKVDHEVRRLSAGDFVWICRDDSRPSDEALLPFIVERKRMDDLAGSIKDGRFAEQKFRLTNCRLANKIYLIENHGHNAHVGLPLTNLLQAATNVQVQNAFAVKYTDSLNDSMFYLAVMTRLLTKMFKNKDVRLSSVEQIDQLPANYYVSISSMDEIQLLSFTEFAEASMKAKSFAIRELFMRQLVQLKTLSIDKAVAITQVYPTPRCLINAYRRCNGRIEAENLLATIQFGKFKKTIGSTISQTLYNFYCKKSE